MNSHIPNIDIYLDSASAEEISEFSSRDTQLIQGITTNPTLIRSAGVTSYIEFVKKLIDKVPTLPISVEVLSDDIQEMKIQAEKLSSIAENIWVKIPVTNTKKESTANLVSFLNSSEIKVNLTAIFTLDQVRDHAAKLETEHPIIYSIFAGRIHDAGQDAELIVKSIANHLHNRNNIKLLWASTREAYNIVQASNSGCHIITMTAPLINKLSNFGKNLESFSQETVQMFLDDAIKSDYKI